ncbi:MAG: phosphoenolpyruvate--protein phosphotransferase [Rhodospirillales bacterium]|jgi:phosphoenolpyruvate-protein phosphotransferase (PTS system enzyme I)|nr:phosphoenolpyruvate--protein phosphotransferase [Rhodospirillales bacterium]MBT5352809.1 phosphoenolpyruvate--protein phosphotransferase [Rhodospirillales bacterium]MBT5520129.1 phosphoenolpyruvate--protein phosphotransferase [Rhodospirillales bacterium]MBT6111940.1 phosphoenolpyruvate--protein phosphotransferase [Rhodospirillales bacterium]MBT6825448.1 phosphoenolpyruvate--protein phosphotransferase [Rhodospirillales bacterium]
MARKTPSAPTREQSFSGLGVSPGIAIGPAYVREHGAIDIPEYTIPDSKIKAECKRLDAAVERAQRQMARLRAKAKTMPETAADELGFLVEAYEQMLKDSRLIRGAKQRISSDHMNAEAAIQAEITDITHAFAAMDDVYIAARIDDIRGVGRRLILNLTQTPVKPFASVPKGSIIIADELTPADTAQLNPERVVGAAADLGGGEGHTAIMARALGLPTVLGAQDMLRNVRHGEMIMIDGTVGRVVINPSKATLDAATKQQKAYRRQAERLHRMRDLPAITRDEVDIILQANVELPIEMTMVKTSGAAGVGLLRSEFMFMGRDDVPDEEEQYESFRDVVLAADGPVTIRTLDVGGEKPAEALFKGMDEKATSALGLRGIRLSLLQPDILETQFRAILRAANHGPVRILLPMVSTVSEVRQAKAILKKAVTKLKRRKATVPNPIPPIGCMIEVPGAALAADALAQVCDFFAIGSNDLTMYTLAIDRGNEYVADLFDPLHPAVLRLIQFSAEAARRMDIPVSICGEMAGDPRYTALLVGLGFRELSMTALNIPRVKQRIRDLDVIAANRRASQIMDQVDSGRIATLIDDMNEMG